MNISEIQRVSPFISPIRIEGGTFYVFNSASEDLTFSFNPDSSRKFKFSKFALLNIPEIKNSPLSNTIKFDAIAGAYNQVRYDNISNYNKLFAESFQNYCLNLETSLLSKTTYNASNVKTVSERVFFKWLKELGAIRFTDTKGITVNNSPRYLEEDNSNYYNRVVKYIGEIDFLNAYFGQENTYNEIYIHIPTEVGDFDSVYFNILEDENYKSGMNIMRIDDSINAEYLMGRKYSDTHPYGLNTLAFYDNPSGLNGIGEETLTQIKQYKKIVGRSASQSSENDYILNDWWYPPTSTKNTYYTEINTFYDASNDELAIYKETGNTSNFSFDSGATKFKRSRLDGIGIDFDPATYAITNNNIYSLIDVARSEKSKDFEFNAVLVYYDIYDNVNESKIVDYDEYNNPIYETTNNFNVLATNLFGVLFLDNVESSESLGGGKIPTYKKCKPNSIFNLNGNAYGFKINLKMDVSPTDSSVNVETVISNSNTMSMDLYADALNEMRKVTEHIEKNVYNTLDVNSKLNELNKYASLFNETNIYSLINRLSSVENTIANNNVYADSIKNKNEIAELINRNYDLLNQFLRGEMNKRFLIDMNMFKSGTGISIESLTDSIIISNTSQNYTYSNSITTSIIDWSNESDYYVYETLLVNGKNYLRIMDTAINIRKNLRLKINDKNIAWQKGQIFKIYFDQDIELSNLYGQFTFTIQTDAINKTKNNEIYGVNVATFTNNNICRSFEIHCIDDKNLKFLIDKIS